FTPAVAAASPAPAVRTGLTADRRGRESRPGPRNCTQGGCTGTIVDGYCDVCGSPADAPPSSPAVAAVHQPTLAEEETPTQRIPRVMTTAQPSTGKLADAAAADAEEERPTQRLPRVRL